MKHMILALAATMALTPAASAPELPENDQIETALLESAHKIEDCRITYYCSCRKCNGSNAGKTASGIAMLPGVTCAVDQTIIPLGADVMIDFGDGQIRYYKADDTGITGAHVDLLAESHEAALRGGVTTATVYWVGGAA